MRGRCRPRAWIRKRNGDGSCPTGTGSLSPPIRGRRKLSTPRRSGAEALTASVPISQVSSTVRPTLADIRAHAQNNGFAFKEHLIEVRPGGLALFNAYEVEGAPGVVVTFVTRLSMKDHERLRNGKANVDINRAARLDAIILADTGYLDTIWGDAKLRGRAYKPIRWEWSRRAAFAAR